MRHLCFLALARLAHDRVRAALCCACLAVALAVPLATGRLARAYERELTARAAATPLLLGAKGSRFDLVLAALWFRPAELPTVPWSELERIPPDQGLAIPIHARFTARGRPIVGTTPEYFELRGLAPARGDLPLWLGECALGADVARELGLGPGDALASDPRELYDLSRPSALSMKVSGVLARSGGPDDRAVLVDVKTAWILEGLVHGHAEPKGGELVLARADGLTTYSEALIELAEVTDASRASFHAHAGPEDLPLSAVIVVPRDAKAATLMRSRVNASDAWQVVSPAEAVGELLGVVLRVKTLLDALAALLLAATLAMALLVTWLAARMRAGEVRTLERIGAPRGAVARLFALEHGLILGASVALALVLAALAGAALPDWSRMIG